MRWIHALCVLAALGLTTCTTTKNRRGLPPLRTVDRLDLPRYLGKWYEIAAFPHRFERGCFGSTAEYSLRDDGTVRVVNRCRKGSLQGPEKVVEGRARVVDPAQPAKLEVNFFGPFWADYWVLALGQGYEYAVVGHPSRDYLWILGRRPTLEEHLYAQIVSRLSAQGYETDRLQRVAH